MVDSNLICAFAQTTNRERIIIAVIFFMTLILVNNTKMVHHTNAYHPVKTGYSFNREKIMENRDIPQRDYCFYLYSADKGSILLYGKNLYYNFIAVLS